METIGLKELWTESFGNEEGWIDTFLRTAFDPTHTNVLTRQGRTAAALAWMEVSCYGEKLAYLYAIATAPAFRGQGLCRELMVKTHRELTRQGYAGTVLVPADAGLRRMYETMGYENFGGLRELSAAAEAPVPIREVTAEAYAALRRALLPPGGVVQEQGAPEYLAASASLYAGEDFLLAARPENGGLFGVELLGNAECAGGILGALGYEQGIFRIPGNDVPFAMFRPLQPGARKPGYFGWAFE